MQIRVSTEKDLETLSVDQHISRKELENIIALNRVYILEEKGIFAGWLRYNLFWDNTPFMNMLFVMDAYRGKGYGKALAEYWEEDMRKLGYKWVMTSTVSDEYAQHLYYKLGYQAAGGFTPPQDIYEIILTKVL